MKASSIDNARSLLTKLKEYELLIKGLTQKDGGSVKNIELVAQIKHSTFVEYFKLYKFALVKLDDKIKALILKELQVKRDQIVKSLADIGVVHDQ